MGQGKIREVRQLSDKRPKVTDEEYEREGINLGLKGHQGEPSNSILIVMGPRLNQLRFTPGQFKGHLFMYPINGYLGIISITSFTFPHSHFYIRFSSFKVSCPKSLLPCLIFCRLSQNSHVVQTMEACPLYPLPPS